MLKKALSFSSLSITIRKNFKLAQIFLVLACLILGISNAQLAFAQTIKLAWDAPTTNENGTPLTDLKEYKLYYGQTSGSSTTTIAKIPSNS